METGLGMEWKDGCYCPGGAGWVCAGPGDQFVTLSCCRQVIPAELCWR